MRIKKSEQKHMDELGDKFKRELAAASLVVRTNPKLVGLDKIREPLAIAAALNATGCPDHQGFVIPKEAGPPMPGIQDIVDTAFKDAIAAARETVHA